MLTECRVRKKSKKPKLYITAPSMLFLVAGFAGGYSYFEINSPTLVSSEGNLRKISVCFSPEGQCEKAVLMAIKSAKQEILVQSYSFTSKSLAGALIDAHKRNIKVRFLFDRSQIKDKHSQLKNFKAAGMEVNIDHVPGIAHSKVMIIDGTMLVTGSYNWSNAANIRNAENILFIDDQKVATIYKKQWQTRFAANTGRRR